MRHWLLPTKEHSEAVWIIPEGDYYIYEIEPEDGIKRGDEIYIWSIANHCLFGWGIVVETPQVVTVDIPGPNGDIETVKKYSVRVNRQKEFRPPITEQMLKGDRNLRQLTPIKFTDISVKSLRPGQAAYLNDFIREHNLDAPQESTTVSWGVLENAPDILVQAIITVGDKTNEGRLVQGVSIAWDEIIKLLEYRPDEIFNIDPRKFEELIAGAYDRAGYRVELTPYSNDKGRDVVATKDGIGSIKIFDQVKRYRINHLVTYEEVMSLFGVISSAPNVSKGVVTTTSDFAPTLLDNEDVRRLVPYRVELKPRKVLLPWLYSLRRL